LFSQASHNSRTTVRQTGSNAPDRARIVELIADLRPDDVDMLRGLHRIQHEFGYIPETAIPLLAQQVNTTPALVFGTIDFYSELRTTPPAENVIEWCSGPACLLKGSPAIRRALEGELGCRLNCSTEDGQFELRLVQCDGTCDLAPQLRFKGQYMGPFTARNAIEFARELRGPQEGIAPSPIMAEEAEETA
jgi:NADH:ubiquinone oxidoreductase subunit E